MTGRVLRTDGGSRGNPGPAAAGFVIENEAGEVLCKGGRFLGKATNNVAEYEGLIWGLENAQSRGDSLSVIYCDSELLVRQLSGQYKVKHPNMKPLFERAKTLITQLGGVEVHHVRREDNVLADGMVNEALDVRGTVGDACDPASATQQESLFGMEG